MCQQLALQGDADVATDVCCVRLAGPKAALDQGCRETGGLSVLWHSFEVHVYHVRTHPSDPWKHVVHVVHCGVTFAQFRQLGEPHVTRGNQ